MMSRGSLLRRGIGYALGCAEVLLPAFAEKAGNATPAPPDAASVYQLPEARRVKLPNGLVLLLVEKHELPLTAMTVMLRTGTLQDPDGKPGLSAITQELLRRGTETKTAEQLANEIDFIGMQFGGGGFGGRGGGGAAAYDNTDIAADFLAKDTDTAMAIVADVVLHPVFPAEELKKAIAQRQERLRTSKDDAQTAAGQYFLAALYAGHPYSRGLAASEASLGSITQDDVKAFYKRVYTPANAVIAVVGDFKPEQMEARLRGLFGAWSGGAPALVAVPALKPVTGRHVVLVDKPDATQTYFILGNVGISENDPNRAPVHIVNTLFGGRFSSMFNEELRIKSGYSYGANSGFEEFRTPGPFVMTTYTRNATTEPAIDKTLEVLARLHTHPFSEMDVTSAKNYLRGGFPPTLETNPALARRLALNEVDGISRAQFNAELAQEQATTLSDANRVIDQDFPGQDNYVLVMVGKASEIGKIAAKYGTVTTLNISDPGYFAGTPKNPATGPSDRSLVSTGGPGLVPVDSAIAGGSASLRRIGGGVSAPVVLFAPEPKFSKEARRAKVGGSVLVYLEVDVDGKPQHVRVLRGVGVGLDEQAVIAVKGYKFKPAMENGMPVQVAMNVEVNFGIYQRP